MCRQCLLPHRLPPPANTLSNHGVEGGLVQGFPKRILTEEALELLAIVYVQTSEAHSECSSVSVGASNTRFGSCRTKTVFPGMDSSRFRQPPCSRAACSAIDSPRPVPLTFSALTNG